MTSPRDLPQRLKVELERKYHWRRETIFKWFELRIALQEVVARRRLGIRGLRPFGSKKPVTECSRSSGSRLRVGTPGVATKQRPLERVFHRLERWFKNEREHRNEIRTRHLSTRLKYELEFERDRELVLQEQSSEKFLDFVLEATQTKLSWFQLSSITRKQKDWMSRVVCPRIGATARVAQRLSNSRNTFEVDKDKALLTWATADRVMHIVARGSRDDLSLFVSDPDEFIKHREATSVVVVDATALWLKLRGEERVFVSSEETTSVAERKRLSRAFEKLDKKDPQKIREFEAQKDKFFEQHSQSKTSS